MLKLMTYKPAFGEPSASPFCTKAICLLNMSGLDWKPEYTSDPRKAPMAKLPVLRDGAFMRAFCDKGYHASKLEKMRVAVALEPKAGLIGAAHYALRL